ncbi:MAG: metallophosphoesterase, partial [Clostridia bacterium]|nr:metallophosphoesterase [Clostridia bacterium]
LLVVCGDCYDRGKENLEIYAFLKSIKNKILIAGNHEDMLIEALKRGSLGKADYHNGTDVTVEQFLGSNNLDPYGRILAPESAKKELYDFADSMYDYFETEKYVFLHGWTPEAITKDKGWRTATLDDWREARWVEWNKLYPEHPKVEGKTVVCGHRSAWFGMTFDETRPMNSFLPFYGDGIVVIDGSTNSSGLVNVLVVEDNVALPQKHHLTVNAEQYKSLSMPKTRFFVIPYTHSDISVGDDLVFTRENEGVSDIKARAVGIYHYPDLRALTRDVSAEQFGLPDMGRFELTGQLRHLILGSYPSTDDCDCGFALIRFFAE